jgi:hypothetical protein
MLLSVTIISCHIIVSLPMISCECSSYEEALEMLFL